MFVGGEIFAGPCPGDYASFKALMSCIITRSILRSGII
jgi:hypothetical protein